MTSHVPLAPFAAYSGSRSPKMLIIGEAWGESEAELRKPFVGASGKLLWQILGEAIGEAPELHSRASAMHNYGLAWVKPREAWLQAVGIGFTNVLALRPMDNKLENISVAKAELPDKGKSYPYGPVSNGKYLSPEYLPELTRLQQEIAETRPNLVVCCGNTAAWAVLGASGIGAIRGTVRLGRAGFTRKTLATYHPAGVMRNWAWRPIVVADLMKGWREAASAELSRPARRININPTIEEVETWTERLLFEPPELLSCDIETKMGTITCIGFAESRDTAMVIPFARLGKEPHYWPNAWQEERAWNLVLRILRSGIPKLFQNGMYDLQYLLRMGFKVNNVREDSMLLHHSIFPELQKGLGFLGSIYTNEPAWKLMRKHRGDEVGVKADE